MANPLKIYPTVDECQIKNKLECPVKDCNQNFTSESNLNLHLTKTHKSTELKVAPLEKWYFCPETKCSWANTKHFKNMKSLRQHFLKVHSAKVFTCKSCHKSFASETLLGKHTQFCDVTFNCLDCKVAYGCYETLKTHCRRKKHRLLNKVDYKGRQTAQQTKSEVFICINNDVILPKRSSSEEIMTRVVPSIDEHCQTVEMKLTSENKTTQVMVTQQTQTGLRNLDMFSVETQTIPPYQKLMKQDSIEETFKNTNTQTDLVESRETSCNTSFNIEEFENSFKNHTEKNSSSTQTHWPGEDIFNIATSTHGSIHTDTSDLLGDSLNNFDTNFFNCNMETQTDLMFENDIFGSDYYSNMYTQTCDEILSGLNGFTDIQTQTGLHDTLRSVESQTLMSSADKLCPNILKDIVHSETQTDAEFRHMLEIINS